MSREALMETGSFHDRPLPFTGPMYMGNINDFLQAPFPDWSESLRIDGHIANQRANQRMDPSKFKGLEYMETDESESLLSLGRVHSFPGAIETPTVCAVQPTDNPHVFVFSCTSPQCGARTFTRWYDFSRHYNGRHATEKTTFWCPIAGCTRSEGNGNRGFPRKDKMMDHVSSMHRHRDDDCVKGKREG
ncbi:hypothetical protein DE146DRAFT_129410 [Phaeosphaeria sp. MPI-PUGE-AT-0046c]|nr:hypothetical protein DE146DRAFT_129410 [Phaeosphaeria sp. MPI-PUGE-AT-0046c]